MSEKKRLDVLVTELGLAESRAKAQQYIMAGEIFVDGQRQDKAGTPVSSDAKIELRGDTCPFVSRGGYKLDKALHVFPISLSGKTCMDIGASTGGFTDCMLQNGAKHVTCVDVGYGQLAWSLRSDSRVTNLERTNVRNLTEREVPEKVDFISIDVSFISLRLVLPVAARFLKEDGEIVALIKPQFEAGKEFVGKNGVIRDPAVHRAAIEGILSFCEENGLPVSGLSFSPVKGPKGNIEFLLHIAHQQAQTDPAAVVKAAHQELDGDDHA